MIYAIIVSLFCLYLLYLRYTDIKIIRRYEIEYKKLQDQYLILYESNCKAIIIGDEKLKALVKLLSSFQHALADSGLDDMLEQVSDMKIAIQRYRETSVDADVEKAKEFLNKLNELK